MLHSGKSYSAPRRCTGKERVLTLLQKRSRIFVCAFTLAATQVFAQQRERPANAGANGAAPEPGIPVTDTLTQARCGGCHTKDKDGNLSRISWIRTTPEGWEQAIKRMVRLNGVRLSPADARSIVKYLAANHGLAPEEAKPVMYMAEHRIQDEVIPNESLRVTCNACHALGQPFQWRRTRAEWGLVADFHSALYPQADMAFRRNGMNFGPPNNEISLDVSLDYLGKNYGLHSPEWAKWVARMRSPKLAGKWLVSARVPGKGRYTGEITIGAGAADDEFTTTAKLVPVNGGAAIERKGTGLVYAGYSWRGRSRGVTAASNVPGDLNNEMRETLWVSPDQTWAEGRWFFGEYQEFGVDVKLRRATSEPMLLTADKYALKTGTTSRVRIIGANLPASLKPADLDFGGGIKVTSIVSQTPTDVVAQVEVASSAVPGKRDIAIGLATLEGPIAVYDTIDYIKVLPEAGLAHLGGNKGEPHPKGYQQLEAIAYHRGPDGKTRTGDDIELGPVEVNWSVEEFFAVFGDDDKEFVGTLDSNGLFTPNVDGPNPQRKFSRNNYGDVWIVATAKNEKDRDGKPVSGKAYLVVTVPTYMRWDQPEVSR